jgi:hypothetical protein
MYIDRLSKNISYASMMELYDNVKEAYHKYDFESSEKLFDFISRLIYQSSVSKKDCDEFNSILEQLEDDINALERNNKIELIQELVGEADGCCSDKPGTTRYWLMADGCYSERSILKAHGWSISELKNTLKSLGLSKDDYRIVYDDETCHLTLPDSLLEEVSVDK